MARKRMIKPEFFVDERIMDLPIPARMLFIGMWVYADDDGIFKNSPKQLKVQIFPSDVKITVGLIEDYVRTMVELTLLIPGESDLLKIKNWHDHQKINHPTTSKYIFEPIKVELSEDSGRTKVEVKEDSGRDPSQYSIDKSNLDKNSIDKNRRSKNEEDYSFDQFYSLYPRKGTKKDSIIKWKYILKRDLKPLFDGLDKWVAYWLGDKVDKQYIPNPVTWLNQKRWEDEDIPTPKTEKDIKFVNDLDEEIYNRNNNIVKQSERMREYIKEAGDNATNEVPNLLNTFKKFKKESNAQPIGDIVGQVMSNAQPDTSTDEG